MLEELAHLEIQIKVEIIELSSLPKNKFIKEKKENLYRVRCTIRDMIEDSNRNRKKLSY